MNERWMKRLTTDGIVPHRTDGAIATSLTSTMPVVAEQSIYNSDGPTVYGASGLAQ